MDLKQAKKRDHKIMITPIAINKVPLVKVEGLSLAECELLQKEHRELLWIAMKQNHSNEVLSMMSMQNGNSIKILGSENKVSVGNSPEAVAIFRHAQKCELAYLHNHPSTNGFSLADILTFIRYANIGMMSVVTNQGKVHILKKNKEYDFAENLKVFDIMLTRYESGECTHNEAVSQFIKTCRKRGVLYESGK